MEGIAGTNQTEPETDTMTQGQKSKGLPRGRNGGRPKGSGVKTVDWARYRRFGFDGLPMEAVARQLGISRRTLARRNAERQRQTEPM
jgi:DNA invertase Pin-like site-specific DNA recombinase